MLRLVGACLAAAVGLGPCGGSSDGNEGETETGAGAGPDAALVAACHASQTAQCPEAVGAVCVGDTCGLDSLPTGSSCDGALQCERAISTCPDWQEHVGTEEVDDYVCACVDGAWACALCEKGAGLCLEAGSPDD
jgi:hypothetical protein